MKLKFGEHIITELEEKEKNIVFIIALVKKNKIILVTGK